MIFDPLGDGQVVLQPGVSIAIGGQTGPNIYNPSGTPYLQIDMYTGATGASRGIISISDTIRVGFTGGTVDLVEFLQVRIGNTDRYIPLFDISGGAVPIYYNNSGPPNLDV